MYVKRFVTEGYGENTFLMNSRSLVIRCSNFFEKDVRLGTRTMSSHISLVLLIVL